MQIVIDISEEKYKSILDDSYLYASRLWMSEVIKNGTVLTEHGRLIDADAIPYIRGTSDVCLPPYVYEYAIKEMPTILEATEGKEMESDDKKESEFRRQMRLSRGESCYIDQGITQC